MNVSILQAALKRAYEHALAAETGEPASYIPELAAAHPDTFAVAVCSAGGEVETVGQADEVFTLQSLCKPFLYAAALTEFGRDEVHRHVGVEPTGEPFNSFIRLESKSHRPHNPMINAGAIAVCALLAQRYDSQWLVDLFRRYTGRKDVYIDMPVYLSEKATADRNRAIAYLLRYFTGLAAPVDQALELYFQACSIRVTSRDVAHMAATFANGGTNPLTGDRVLESGPLRDVLTVMTTCGMYDSSGKFLFEIGLPAKSGVSGGLLAVLPERFGIGAYAPRLDRHGSTVRGTMALRSLATELRWHLFQPRTVSPTAGNIPSDRLAGLLRDVASECKQLHEGDVARYAPALATVDPELLGLSLCTVAGTEVHHGDTTAAFSLQAAGNPFTYAMALTHLGPDNVHNKVGVEPSGNPFDAVLFEPETQKPFNPLNNAGAITIAAHLPGLDSATRLKNLLAWLGALAGVDRLPIDASIVASEEKSGDRNRAIAHLLKNFGVIDEVDRALELYFQQCAVLVTVSQLARMGSTLANGGRNPITKKAVLPTDLVPPVLSVMFMCGMHDESGRFAFEVGMPAKSGISGGIVAVVPGVCGIAAYSPRVDVSGSSVRGVAALQKLARSLRLGVFDSV